MINSSAPSVSIVPPGTRKRAAFEARSHNTHSGKTIIGVTTRTTGSPWECDDQRCGIHAETTIAHDSKLVSTKLGEKERTRKSSTSSQAERRAIARQSANSTGAVSPAR